MRVFLLSNSDLTSSLIFAPLIESGDVEIAGVGFSKTLIKDQPNWVSAVFALLKRMDRRYWIYLVFQNACFKLFEWLTLSFNLAPRHGWLVSLRALCKVRGIPLHYESSFNDARFVELLRRSECDLVVVRIDQILSAEILDVAKFGFWCVHSSLLPGYRGIASEFQALRHGESRIGTSIFQVEVALDKGQPVHQDAFATIPGQSLFRHMVRNNQRAGTLLEKGVDSLRSDDQVAANTVEDRPEPSYFSWPAPGQVAEFHGRGGRLISLQEALALLLSAIRLRKPFAVEK